MAHQHPSAIWYSLAVSAISRPARLTSRRPGSTREIGQPGVGCLPAGAMTAQAQVRAQAAAAGAGSKAEESQKSRPPALEQLERPSDAVGFSISSKEGHFPGSVRRRVGRSQALRCHRATRAGGSGGHPVGRCGNRRLPASPARLRRGSPTRKDQGPFITSAHGGLSPLAETAIGAARFGHMGQTPSPACCRSHLEDSWFLKAHEAGGVFACAGISTHPRQRSSPRLPSTTIISAGFGCGRNTVTGSRSLNTRANARPGNGGATG